MIILLKDQAASEKLRATPSAADLFNGLAGGIGMKSLSWFLRRFERYADSLTLRSPVAWSMSTTQVVLILVG